MEQLELGTRPMFGPQVGTTRHGHFFIKNKNALDKPEGPIRVVPFLMRKSPLTVGLLVLLCANVLASAFLSCWYVRAIRRIGNLQKSAAVATYNRNIVQALANEAAEYAKKNPQMENLLKSYKPSSPATTTNLTRPITK